MPSPGRDQRTASGPMSRGRDRDSGTRHGGSDAVATCGADTRVGMIGTYNPGHATCSSWQDARWEWEPSTSGAMASNAASSTTSNVATHPGCTGDEAMTGIGSEGPSIGLSDQSPSAATPSLVHSCVQGDVNSPGLMDAGVEDYPSASLLIEVLSSSSEGARDDTAGSRCNANGLSSLNELD